VNDEMTVDPKKIIEKFDEEIEALQQEWNDLFKIEEQEKDADRH